MSEAHVVKTADHPDEAPGREGWQNATPWVLGAIMLIGPLVLIPALGGQDAVIPVFVLMFGASLVAGLVDGLFYRPNATLALIAGGAFVGAKALYFNDGTLIYAFACGALATLGMGIGGAVAKRGGQ